jgi:hypothetical protein
MIFFKKYKRDKKPAFQGDEGLWDKIVLCIQVKQVVPQAEVPLSM